MGHATESNNKGKKTRQNSWKYFLKHVRTMYQGLNIVKENAN